MKEFLGNLKKTWHYEKKNKKNIIILIIMELLMIVVRIVIPLISAKKIIYLTSSTFDKLVYVCIMIFLTETMYNVFRFFGSKHLIITYMNSQNSMQLDIGKNILKLENECLDKNGSGKFVQRLTNDVYKIPSIFVSFVQCLSDVIREVGIYIAIFIINF